MNTCNPHELARAFLKQHGTSLAAYGSSEYGLRKKEAENFIDLLWLNGMNVTGVEIWRWQGARHKIDSIMTWYAIETDISRNMEEAKSFVSTIKLAENDVMAIQFR